MKRRELTLLLAGLVLIGGTAGLLGRLKTHQRLGKPGVRTTPIPGSANLRILLPEKVLDYQASFLARFLQVFRHMQVSQRGGGLRFCQFSTRYAGLDTVGTILYLLDSRLQHFQVFIRHCYLVAVLEEDLCDLTAHHAETDDGDFQPFAPISSSSLLV